MLMGGCGRHDRGPARLLIAAVLNIKASTAADAEAPFAILSLFWLRPIDGDRRFFEREAFLNQPVYNASSSARVSKFDVAVGPKPLRDIKARRIFVSLFVAVPGKEHPRVATPHEQIF
jgi:hypothetical protein